MEGIEHKTVSVNGINMHIAEKGQGPLVLFLLGFPELWYSWRHQIVYMAAHGYRVVALDLRGYGDTTGAPTSATQYTVLHLVGDLVALLDAIAPEQDKVFVNNPQGTLVEILHAAYGDDHYIYRFLEPGKIEAEFAGIGTKRVLKKFLTFRNPEPFYFPKGKGFGDSPDTPVILPSWLSEEDIDYYATKFEHTGFTGGLNYYRALPLNWELSAPWTGAQVKVPAKFIAGYLDLAYHMPGVKEYIRDGGFKKDVPLLQEAVVIQGAAHFINQEKPDEINKHILDFIKNF